MAKQQTDNLIQLVTSLSKAEKRNFRLYANRQNSTEDKLFILLFDYIESSKNYSEEELLKKNLLIKKAQLSNIKANLYKQLLSSLRLLHRNTYADISIRELLDSAKILHSKGMYQASLDLIEKAKKAAYTIKDYSLAYNAIDYERKIENQYITGSMSEKAVELKKESDQLVDIIKNSNDLSNLSLMLYGLYLKYGYVKDKKDFEYITAYFESYLPKINLKDLKFYDKIFYFQSYVWYYHMIQDFANYYKFSQKWVDTFKNDLSMIEIDKPLFIKGLHNTLNALYMAGKKEKFLIAYEDFKTFSYSDVEKFSTNEESVYQMIYSVHLLNKIFLTGEYDAGVKEIQPLELILKKNTFGWDINRILVFYYKVACVYFGSDNHNKSLTYLNFIINHPSTEIRQDIQCFARILNLIAHYELKNEILISYQIKSVIRFLSNMEDLQGVQKEILSFLRKTPKMQKADLKNEFKKLKSKLLVYNNLKFEKRPFLYLDIIAWLDSKINGTRIQEEIRKKIG
jgi:hypothetical protein